VGACVPTGPSTSRTASPGTWRSHGSSSTSFSSQSAASRTRPSGAHFVRQARAPLVVNAVEIREQPGQPLGGFATVSSAAETAPIRPSNAPDATAARAPSVDGTRPSARPAVTPFHAAEGQLLLKPPAPPESRHLDQRLGLGRVTCSRGAPPPR
jgi:hypothetical protein